MGFNINHKGAGEKKNFKAAGPTSVLPLGKSCVLPSIAVDKSHTFVLTSTQFAMYDNSFKTSSTPAFKWADPRLEYKETKALPKWIDESKTRSKKDVLPWPSKSASEWNNQAHVQDFKTKEGCMEKLPK